MKIAKLNNKNLSDAEYISVIANMFADVQERGVFLGHLQISTPYNSEYAISYIEKEEPIIFPDCVQSMTIPDGETGNILGHIYTVSHGKQTVKITCEYVKSE